MTQVQVCCLSPGMDAQHRALTTLREFEAAQLDRGDYACYLTLLEEKPDWSDKSKDGTWKKRDKMERKWALAILKTVFGKDHRANLSEDEEDKAFEDGRRRIDWAEGKVWRFLHPAQRDPKQPDKKRKKFTPQHGLTYFFATDVFFEDDGAPPTGLPAWRPPPTRDVGAAKQSDFADASPEQIRAWIREALQAAEVESTRNLTLSMGDDVVNAVRRDGILDSLFADDGACAADLNQLGRLLKPIAALASLGLLVTPELHDVRTVPLPQDFKVLVRGWPWPLADLSDDDQLLTGEIADRLCAYFREEEADYYKLDAIYKIDFAQIRFVADGTEHSYGSLCLANPALAFSIVLALNRSSLLKFKENHEYMCNETDAVDVPSTNADADTITATMALTDTLRDMVAQRNARIAELTAQLDDQDGVLARSVETATKLAEQVDVRDEMLTKQMAMFEQLKAMLETSNAELAEKTARVRELTARLELLDANR